LLFFPIIFSFVIVQVGKKKMTYYMKSKNEWRAALQIKTKGGQASFPIIQSRSLVVLFLAVPH
jgi:hypothetical protein